MSTRYLGGEMAWVEGAWPATAETVEPQEEVSQTLTTEDLSALTTAQLT